MCRLLKLLLLSSLLIQIAPLLELLPLLEMILIRYHIHFPLTILIQISSSFLVD